jgi:superfamily II DNA or RNA helicase
MPLRTYQQDQVNGARRVLNRNRSVLLQLATGGGKTHEFSDITARTTANGHRTWIVVPRNELLRQASDHLSKYNVPHGLISASSQESRAYKVHVVSKDTLIRRYEKIKNWPDLLIMDEAHLYLDRQIEIASHLPERSKIIGVTATPERLDGRGLSTESGGMYDDIVYGPTIAELVEMDYLSNMRYFCPPGAEEIKELHRRGTEYNPDELEALLQRRKIYGGAIQHYREHAHNKAALVFCRSVKAAAETAQRFNDAGYKFENIDGKMSYSRRKGLIDGLRTGDIQGLTSCELITYGLDVPRVECIIMLRPTLSRTLYFQMIGRGLRPSPGKDACVILDHVGNLQEHGHPLEPYEWQFHGREKRTGSQGVSASTLRLCGACFLYFEGDTCPNCGGARKVKKRADMEEIDGRLVEVPGPVDLRSRPVEEQREYEDKVNALVEACQLKPDGEGLYKIDESAVSELLMIAEGFGHQPMWVYHRVSEGQMAVNVPLLHAIAKVKGYEPGWVWHKKKELRGRNAGIDNLKARMA